MRSDEPTFPSEPPPGGHVVRIEADAERGPILPALEGWSLSLSQPSSLPQLCPSHLQSPKEPEEVRCFFPSWFTAQYSLAWPLLIHVLSSFASSPLI